jgi:hypothetical protein
MFSGEGFLFGLKSLKNFHAEPTVKNRTTLLSSFYCGEKFCP